MKKNKKANMIVDTILLIIILVVLGMVVFIMNNISEDMDGDVQSDASMSEFAKNVSADMSGSYHSIWDDIFLFTFVFVWAMALVSSYFADTHPLFFVFALVLMVGVYYFAAEASNFFMDFVDMSEFTGYQAKFPMVFWIMNHLVEEVVLMSLAIGLMLYGKNKWSQ